MLHGEQTNRTAESEAADETDLATPVAASPDADRHDAPLADDNDAAISKKDSPKAKKRKTGRPPKLTPENLEKIRVVVAAGLPVEFAANCAGVGASTLYQWQDEGRAAFDKQRRGQVLSTRERGCIEVVLMLRDAHAERQARLYEKYSAEAMNRRERMTTVTFKALVYKGNVVYDEDGEFLMVPTVRMVTKEGADMRALARLLDKSYERMDEITNTAIAVGSADGTDAHKESTTRRLAQSVRVYKDQMDEERKEAVDRGVEERLRAMGITAPTADVHPSATDDDDDDYYYGGYAPWVPPTFAEFDSGNSGNSGNPDVDRGT